MNPQYTYYNYPNDSSYHFSEPNRSDQRRKVEPPEDTAPLAVPDYANVTRASTTGEKRAPSLHLDHSCMQVNAHPSSWSSSSSSSDYWKPNASNANASVSLSATMFDEDFDRHEKALLDSVSTCSSHALFGSTNSSDAAATAHLLERAALFSFSEQHRQMQEDPHQQQQGNNQGECASHGSSGRTPSPTQSFASSSSSTSSEQPSSSFSGSGHCKRKNDRQHHNQAHHQRSVHGRKGDPRMHISVSLRLADPRLPLLDALIGGGFNFIGLGQPRASDRTVRDDEGILLYQRKNQLNRRLRQAKNKHQQQGEGMGGNGDKEKRKTSSSNKKQHALEKKKKKTSTRTTSNNKSKKNNEQSLQATTTRHGSTASLDDFFMALPTMLDGDMNNDESNLFSDQLTREDQSVSPSKEEYLAHHHPPEHVAAPAAALAIPTTPAAARSSSYEEVAPLTVHHGGAEPARIWSGTFHAVVHK